MAIAFDAASSGSGNGVSGFSWTHTPSGTPTTAIVGIVIRDDAASVVSVDYGTTPMVFVRADLVSLVVHMETWILNNPPAGAKLVSVSTSTTMEGTGIAVTVTGSATSGQPANHAGATGNSTAPTATVSSGLGRLVIGFVDSERNNTDAQIAPGAGQTQRASISGPTLDRPRQEVTDEAGAASVVTSWTLTTTTNWVVQALDLSAVTAVEQEGYRWRNDDGTETTATWKAAQDTTVTLNPSDVARLRVIVNATNDPASANYKLQYRKVGDPSWKNIDKFQ